jgi:hypothetical protein
MVDPLAALNSSFRWRDHLRLIAFHPLLVRSFGGLARGACNYYQCFMCSYSNGCHARTQLCPTPAGTFLFRAHPTALSSSGMRASADELSAGEALTVTLVVHVDNVSLL